MAEEKEVVSLLFVADATAISAILLLRRVK